MPQALPFVQTLQHAAGCCEVSIGASLGALRSFVACESRSLPRLAVAVASTSPKTDAQIRTVDRTMFFLQMVPGEKRARPRMNQRTGPARHNIRDRAQAEWPVRTRQARLGQLPASFGCWQTQKSLSISASASATGGSQSGRAPSGGLGGQVPLTLRRSQPQLEGRRRSRCGLPGSSSGQIPDALSS